MATKKQRFVLTRTECLIFWGAGDWGTYNVVQAEWSIEMLYGLEHVETDGEDVVLSRRTYRTMHALLYFKKIMTSCSKCYSISGFSGACFGSRWS
jgi:hypothetical protein